VSKTHGCKALFTALRKQSIKTLYAMFSDVEGAKTITISTPVYWFPSSLLVAKEQLIVSSLKCPQCGSQALEIVTQSVLPPKTSKYPIGGDKFICKCNNCGYQLTVNIVFREPEPTERALSDFDFVYDSLLNAYSSSMIPNYFNFITTLSVILQDFRNNDPEDLYKILDKILNDLSLLLASLEAKSDQVTSNKLKLLSLLISELPEDDFKYIINRSSGKIRHFLQLLRVRA
jgi:hypothetical protein